MGSSAKRRSPHEAVLYITRVISLVAVIGCTAHLFAQQLKHSDRDLLQRMLRDVAGDVQKNYYDPKFHSVDWEATVKKSKEAINKADSLNAGVSEIAAALDILDDSHTFFLPPPRPFVLDYGFTMQMVGDHCYATHIRKGSDAEKRGLKVGDEILAVNGHPVTRKTMWRITYIYQTLRPQPGLQLTLADPGKTPRNLEIQAKFRPSSDVKYGLHQGINERMRDYESYALHMRVRIVEKENGLFIAKLPIFGLTADDVDFILGKMRKHPAVVLDLRGNLGGAVSTLERLLGGLFENDEKIYDLVERNQTKSVSTTGRHHEAYTHRLAVLIDAESASASEIFARVVQLQRRGFIIGDRSSGNVMMARHYPHELYTNSLSYYAASITIANLIMTDGQSLEHLGVEPDILMLPTAQDLAADRDPVLSKAAGLMGDKITPEEAGALFPYEEPPE